MHQKDIKLWQHLHVFGQDQTRSGEKRTIIVAIITCVTMIVEISSGVMFRSMALLADGLHMASHTTALGINSLAYIYARRHSSDKHFNFGTGKVNTLGGFIGALLLGFFALFMIWESVKRMLSPVWIAYNPAILVAVIGLIVNGASVRILAIKGSEHRHDHNLRSAYLHVLADAFTSILAIAALLMAKFLGLVRMDPLMGIIGGLMVSHWSWRLLQTTGRILLDKTGPEEIQQKIKETIEKDGDSRVADLHLWSVGPNIYSVIISVVACNPLEVEQYKKLLPRNLGLLHVTVEVHTCKHEKA